MNRKAVLNKIFKQLKQSHINYKMLKILSKMFETLKWKEFNIFDLS